MRLIITCFWPVSATWKLTLFPSTRSRRKKKAGGASNRGPRDWDPPTKLSDQPVPNGWEYHTDPYGRVHFYNESLKLVAWDNVTSPSKLRRLMVEYEKCVTDLKDYLATLDDYLINLSLAQYRGIVDYDRCISMALPWDGKHFILNEDPFWDSLIGIPIHPLPQGAEEIMLAALVYEATELVLGAKSTTSRYTLDQCLTKISLYKTLKNETSKVLEASASETSRRSDPITVRRWSAALNMGTIAIGRLHYHYGEANAGTTIQQRIPDPSWKRHLWDVCVLVLCFGSHKIYRERMRRTLTIDGVQFRRFVEFVHGTLQEWSDIKLLGSVFILANMTLLSVSQSLPTKTLKTLIFVSTILSVANLIGSLYLISKHQKHLTHYVQGNYYLHHLKRYKTSISLTSVLLTLPTVFLIWSMVTFSAAMLYTSIQVFKRVSLRYLSLVASVVIIIIFCMFLYGLWRTSDSASVVFRIWRTIRGRRADRADRGVDIEMDKMEGADGS